MADGASQLIQDKSYFGGIALIGRLAQVVFESRCYFMLIFDDGLLQPFQGLLPVFEREGILFPEKKTLGFDTFVIVHFEKNFGLGKAGAKVWLFFDKPNRMP